MNTPPIPIKGLRSLNLEPEAEAYLLEQVERGKRFFVSRARGHKRCIQGSADTEASAMRTFEGWRGYRRTLFEVTDRAVRIVKTGGES